MHERNTYPHLLSQDAPVMTAYLTNYGHHYNHVDFDLRVGAGRDPGPQYDDNIRQMAFDLSRRRIDCVGYADDYTDIIEVTDAAGMTALGQLIAYKTLWLDDNHTAPEPKLILVARTIQTDMGPAFVAAGIVTYLYPEAR